MARRRIQFGTELTEVALVAATIKTVVEVAAPTNIKLEVKEIGVSFDGTGVTDAPAEVSLARKSVAGTGTTATAREYDEDASGTIQSSGKVNMTAEGTITYDFHGVNVHQQAGYIEKFDEGELSIEPGGILGLRVNAGANVNAHGYIDVME